MNEKPIYVINGAKRRVLKKKLNSMKYLLKMYWFYTDVEEVYDMVNTQEDNMKVYKRKEEEIKFLENVLSAKIKKDEK